MKALLEQALWLVIIAVFGYLGFRHGTGSGAAFVKLDWDRSKYRKPSPPELAPPAPPP